MKLKPLVRMMAMLPAMALPGITALHASDLSIYKPNSGGKTSILLMLDTSGSMGISSLVLPKDNKFGSPGDVERSLCGRNPVKEDNNSNSTNEIQQWKYNAEDKRTGSSTYGKTSFKKTVTIPATASTPATTIDYYLRGCGNPTIDANGNLVESDTGKFDRLSRLKDAVIQLLASNGIDDSVKIGLGHFSTKTGIKVGATSNTNVLIDGHSGSILVPVDNLTAAHRIKLINALKEFKSVDTMTNEDGTENKTGTKSNLRLSSITYPNIFKASSGTPTAHAYAEAAAYLMGTTTGTLNPPASVGIVYDGYAVIQNNNDANKQVYYVCVALNGETGQALGNTATSMYCDNEWNKSNSDWYNTAKKRMHSSVKIYKPDDNGGWIPVTAEQLQDLVGDMNSLWETHEKLPDGWRYGGWMKVPDEPMDIEPIGGKVWPNKDSNNLVSYRSSPFSVRSGSVTGTTVSWSNCPTGYTISDTRLCQKTITSISRDATVREQAESTCLAPVVGQDPILNVYLDPGKLTDAYRNNKNNTTYSNKKCTQTKEFIARPWTTTNKSVTGPIDNLVGGFYYSHSDAKNGSNYKRGGSASQCDGNGIYFLTDGAPNSTKDNMARTIMNLSLVQSSYQFTSMPTTNTLVSPQITSSMFEGETGGWEYIGAYAKKLRDPTKNPANMGIKTAVVGFGTTFAGIPKNSDGSYNCEAIKSTNLDSYNACKWGSEEYGDGGFYYAENVEDIKSSIMEFVNRVQVPFTATSLGSVSIPRDPLDQTQIVTEGFFPMISPMDDSEAAAGQKYMTWAGNLKKYKIVDGTLKDKNNNAIYITENNQQKINSTAQDLWSIASTSDDHSDIMSGGSLNKIPVPSLLNITGQPSNSNSVRNVYTIDGTTLKKVTKSNVATDITGTNALSNSITVEQRYALLNYLGYVAPTTSTTLTTAQLNNLLTVPASPYRHMGGVVHSTPVLATKEVKISSGDNAIESRKEYVVYGTMEGGLHIVDASTGEEKSVFVPKEILTSQAATLANKDPRGNGLAYGVDAPWAIDSQYKVKTTTDVITQTVTTAYEANILRAYGGLRMGGIGFYGLNISDVTAPELLFHIDRSKSGFERIAQIWSKPTITEIRHEGKRKHVLILGGGYDADKYENETVENPSSLPTMGNALYVIDAETGELIWSTSSMISDQNATSTINETKNVDVKYSVVAQPAVRDYDSDGLADMIYFADLGGQIFRVDLNNLAHMNTTKRNIAVRVQKIANLAEANFVPRFYDRVTTAVFGSGNERHVFVSVGSGNRSFPLKGSPVKNKVYGILDYDAAKNGLEKTGFNTFQAVATMGASSNMLNRGSVGKNSSGANTLTLNGVTVTTANGKTNLNDTNKVSLLSNGTKRGWYFELTSTGDGTPAGSFYAKAFEEPQLVVGDLYVSVYDPKASLGTTTSSCGGGVQGVSTIHRLCAPYGDCAANVTTGYQGIIGSTLGGLTNPARTTQLIGPITPAGEKCVGRCDKDNQTADDQPLKKYSQRRVIRPTRWFEW